MQIEIVDDIREMMKKDNEYAKRVIKGEARIDKRRAEKKIIMTPETFSKIFSPERIKLMLKVKQNNIRNIYQLAKELNRKYEAVYRDIKLLEGFGVIRLEEKEREKVPIMDQGITLPQFAAS